MNAIRIHNERGEVYTIINLSIEKAVKYIDKNKPEFLTDILTINWYVGDIK